MTQQNSKSISLHSLFRRFWAKITFTWFLVIGEATLLLLFPLFIGYAIDDLLESSYRGLLALGGIGLLSLIVGACRRFYDTRIYSKIYATVSPELVEKEQQRDSSVSVISARTNLVNEFVEFFENYFPAIIHSFISLGGALIIIFFLKLNVFVACLIATFLIVMLYALTSKKTYTLNSGFNSELENQVKVLEEKDRDSILAHFRNVIKWNIRLSDLETANFSISWFILIGVLVYSIIAVIESGISSHGQILAILMYVFNYIESVIALPLFYQQIVRLQEISHRLDSEG